MTVRDTPDQDARPRVVVLTLLALVAFMLASRLLLLTSSTNGYDSGWYVVSVVDVIRARAPIFSNLEFGHPLYLAWCALVCGALGLTANVADVIHGCKIAGIVAVATSVWPGFWLARWLLGSARWGLVAVAIYCVVPVTWWWSGEIMSDAVGLSSLLWSFGFLARWLERRSTWNLAAASATIGATVLVRLACVAYFPLFGGLVLVGLMRRRRVAPLLVLFLVPLPLLALIFIDMQLSPGKSFADYFVTSPNNAGWTFSRLTDSHHLSLLREQSLHALGWWALACAALGFAVTLFLRIGVAAFTLAWVGLGVLLPYLRVNDGSQIRYLLPVAPAAALLVSQLLRAIARLPRGVWLSRAGFLATVAALAIHAWPDLHALHTRENFADASVRWYRQNTPEDAVLLVGGDGGHVRSLLPDREAIFLELQPAPWLASLVTALPEVVDRVDTALRAGRRVFCARLAIPERGALERYFRFEVRDRIDGETLRNVADIGFIWLGERMREPHDLVFYELSALASTPRLARAPSVLRLSASSVEVSAHYPLGAGCYCTSFLSARPRVIGTLIPRPAPDALIVETLPLNPMRPFDARGRCVVRLDLSRLASIPAACSVGYVVQRKDGSVVAYSGFARLPVPIVR